MKFKGYTGLTLVHKGSMTEIYRARQESDGRKVILKINSGHSELSRWLYHEYKMTSQCNCACVVKPLKIDNSGPQALLVFEDDSMHSLDSFIPPKGS